MRGMDVQRSLSVIPTWKRFADAEATRAVQDSGAAVPGSHLRGAYGRIRKLAWALAARPWKSNSGDGSEDRKNAVSLRRESAP